LAVPRRSRTGLVVPKPSAALVEILIAISGDPWPDDLRLSDIEGRFVCQVCGKRGADVRPDFNWNSQPNVFDYIERFYNSKRRYSTIGYLALWSSKGRLG
jgi:hypothetical protein